MSFDTHQTTSAVITTPFIFVAVTTPPKRKAPANPPGAPAPKRPGRPARPRAAPVDIPAEPDLAPRASPVPAVPAISVEELVTTFTALRDDTAAQLLSVDINRQEILRALTEISDKLQELGTQVLRLGAPPSGAVPTFGTNPNTLLQPLVDVLSQWP